MLYLSASNTCTAQTTTGTAKKTLIIGSSKNAETAKTDSSGAFVFTCDKTKCTRYISSNYLGVNGVNKYLYKCADTGVCTSTDTTADGYYLSGPTTVVGTDNTYSSMIKCTDTTSSNCSDITSPSDGFYLSADTTSIKLIKCESGICKDYTSSLTASGTSYFKDGSTTTNIIKCNGNTSCTSIEGSKGYYINSDKSNSIIKCNGTCNVEDAKSSCSISGQVIGPTIKLCITASESKEISTSATNDSYEIITIAKDNDFPGGKKKGENIIKIGKDGSALLIEKVSLPTCKATTGSVKCFNNAVNNAICIKDGKLYKTTVGTGTDACAAETLSGSIKYFKSDYTEGTLSATGDTAAMAYECTTTECNFVRGYVSIGTPNIRCNGWTEGCEVITAGLACSANDEGSLISRKLCFGTTEYTLPSSEEKIAFELSQTSGIYGGKKGDIIILNTSATKAVNTTLADGNI